MGERLRNPARLSSTSPPPHTPSFFLVSPFLLSCPLAFVLSFSLTYAAPTNSLATLQMQARVVDIDDPRAASILLRGSPLLHIDHEGLTKDECADMIAIRTDVSRLFARSVGSGSVPFFDAQSLTSPSLAETESALSTS